MRQDHHPDSFKIKIGRSFEASASGRLAVCLLAVALGLLMLGTAAGKL
jgi:hypothetical protein